MNAKSIICAGIYLFKSVLYSVNPSGSLGFSNGSKALFIRDVFSVINNPSIIGDYKRALIGMSTCRLYNLKVLNETSICAFIPIQNSSLGFSYIEFGNRIYKQSKYTFSATQMLHANLCFALKSDYIQIGIVNYGRQSMFNLDACLYSKINSHFNSSIILGGIIQKSKKDFITNEKYAVIGINYKPERHIECILELYKSHHYKTEFNPSIIYQKDSSFTFSFGFSSHFNKIGLGITWKHKSYSIGTAVQVHTLLGLSSNISLSYEFKK